MESQYPLMSVGKGVKGEVVGLLCPEDDPHVIGLHNG